jgi:hypothetical protein
LEAGFDVGLAKDVEVALRRFVNRLQLLPEFIQAPAEAWVARAVHVGKGEVVGVAALTMRPWV